MRYVASWKSNGGLLYLGNDINAETANTDEKALSDIQRNMVLELGVSVAAMHSSQYLSIVDIKYLIYAICVACGHKCTNTAPNSQDLHTDHS